MSSSYEAKLKQALDKILHSRSPKKLIVAGPGTGKTTMFRRLLETSPGDRNDRLVLTFLNNLKAELDEKLSSLARVFTFHGYCHYLLRNRGDLRKGLTGEFTYYPALARIIKRDWGSTNTGSTPEFIGSMRDLREGQDTTFFLLRSNYYDAIAFDDSVFRVWKIFKHHPDRIGSHALILVDEYQDFNRLEASFIDLLAGRSPITIVGDDDQALYRQLRSATHEFIRRLHGAEEYVNFELPFCMRCPKPIVEAISDVLVAASKGGYLKGRIEKPYLYYPPQKEGDSLKYPSIKVIEVSAQRADSNYMGRYIAQAIRKIPADETKESLRDGYPTVLIIGPRPYLPQVCTYLESAGFDVETKEQQDVSIERWQGLQLLQSNPSSNLGWRIILESESLKTFNEVIRASVKTRKPLSTLIDPTLKRRILNEAKKWRPPEETVKPPPTRTNRSTRPTIKATSFEGSKGLSAQHVFILGLQENELPRNTQKIDDLEICKFLVALTRARKQATILFTWRFAGIGKRPSLFIDWISGKRKELIRIDKDYW